MECYVICPICLSSNTVRFALYSQLNLVLFNFCSRPSDLKGSLFTLIQSIYFCRTSDSSGQGNGNHPINTGLNRSSTSPAKMNQVVRSRSHDKELRSRDMQLSLQNSNRRISDRVSDVTPTHDPYNPRFVLKLLFYCIIVDSNV